MKITIIKDDTFHRRYILTLTKTKRSGIAFNQIKNLENYIRTIIEKRKNEKII